MELLQYLAQGLGLLGFFRKKETCHYIYVLFSGLLLIFYVSISGLCRCKLLDLIHLILFYFGRNRLSTIGNILNQSKIRMKGRRKQSETGWFLKQSLFEVISGLFIISHSISYKSKSQLLNLLSLLRIVSFKSSIYYFPDYKKMLIIENMKKI